MSVLAIGLISGTSADGIDAVLVRFEDSDDTPQAVAALTFPYPDDLRRRVLEAIGSRRCDPRSLMRLDAECGDAFAAAAMAVAQAGGVAMSAISVIGSHGQTIAHHPDDGTTLQVGDPNRIAATTGSPVVADFRRADMACGGQGAPLAPLLHRRLFGADGQQCAVLNLGGIANLTLIDESGVVSGFDTGPGNALLDGWAARHGLGDRDDEGRFAASGMVDDGLLQRLLDDDYFRRTPPKSTGREYFSMDWLDARLGPESGSPADVQATLVALTARSVATNATGHTRLYVCGGGVHNTALMDALRDELPGCVVASSAEAGVDPDTVEATLFAWLAYQRIDAQSPPGLAGVTGAGRAAILGGVWLPPGH